MSLRSRRGFSLLELVVLLFCVALLVALVLPAIQSSRTRGRRPQCLNNMRNVGLGIQNFASQNGGKLPPLDDGTHSWPRLLLRVLDQPALDRKIAAGEALDDREATIQVFTCNEDDDSYQQPGGLSYVVNSGYGFFPTDRKNGTVTEKGRHSLAQDWDGDVDVSDEDRSVTKATGVFWRPDDGVQRVTLDYLGEGDGAGSTLLLTESLHAGPWTGRDVRGLAFVVDRGRLTFDGDAGPLAVSKADLGPFAINGAKDADGPVPAPSSNHPDSVNVIWADGRGGALSDQIDPLVYVRILTSAGSVYGEEGVEDSEI